MTTRIFHEHGLWVGRYLSKNGYPGYENADIKDITRGMVDGKVDGQRLIKQGYTKEDFHRVFDDRCPEDWVFKTGIDWWDLWQGYPAKFVFVQRRIEGVAMSLHKGHGRDLRGSIRSVTNQYEFMDQMSEKHGIPIVRTDELIRGDYSSIKAAMDYCGLSFDPKIADRCIEVKRWHH